jgi:predicted LPLAT superfamily acyltransferase
VGTRPPDWISQAERGQTLAIRLIVWVALKVGRRAARLLLYPITLYFLLFSISAREASRRYLRRVLPVEPRVTHLFRHYHTFASTILDRVFFLHGEYGRFDVQVSGEQIVRDHLAHGEGCLLFGAHVGSFEVIRALGREAGGARISMVMYEDNARKINSVLNAINPEAVLDVIPLGRIDSMLKVQNALARGELVGILADRAIAGEGMTTRSFLGAPARVPLGPFRIAAMLKRPVVLMFGIYKGGNRYEIHFENLVDLRHVNRSERAAVLDAAITKYVERLEHYCRTAPYNWFNFYDYWA